MSWFTGSKYLPRVVKSRLFATVQVYVNCEIAIKAYPADVLQ